MFTTTWGICFSLKANPNTQIIYCLRNVIDNDIVYMADALGQVWPKTNEDHVWGSQPDGKFLSTSLRIKFSPSLNGSLGDV